MGRSLAARLTPAGLCQGFAIRSSPSGTLRALLIPATSAPGGAARSTCLGAVLALIGANQVSFAHLAPRLPAAGGQSSQSAPIGCLIVGENRSIGASPVG